MLTGGFAQILTIQPGRQGQISSSHVCRTILPYPAAAPCSSGDYFSYEFSLYIFLHMQWSSQLVHGMRVCHQIEGLHVAMQINGMNWWQGEFLQNSQKGMQVGIIFICYHSLHNYDLWDSCQQYCPQVWVEVTCQVSQDYSIFWHDTWSRNCIQQYKQLHLDEIWEFSMII